MLIRTAARPRTLLRRTFAAYRQSLEGAEAGNDIPLDSFTARLTGIVVALYAVELIIAILFHRHLFGDAAWFLVRVLSENHATHWETDFSCEFFRSRWFTFHLTQWPVLWASWVGVTSLGMLSWVFGVGLFLHRPLSLLLCWWWLKDKRLFLFPLASLLAGSINAELYIVSETHFLLSLVWPLIVLLLCADLTLLRRRACLVVIAIPTLLAYETMAFFGPVLAVAAGIRAGAQWHRPKDRILFLGVAVYFALGSLFALLAIALPRDTSNRGTFVSGIWTAVERGHLGIAASVWLVLMFPVVLYLWPRHHRASAAVLGAPVLLGVLYAARVFVQPGLLDFETHMFARGINLLVPLPLCLMFFGLAALHAARRQALTPVLRAVASFGLVQCVWALGATVFWANMVTALRLELARTIGVVPYQSTVLSKPTFRGMPMQRLHAVWPLLPMSIVLAGTTDVSAVVFADSHPFAPFNPAFPSELPELSRFGVDYTRLRQSLVDNGLLDFRAEGNAGPFLRDGWWIDSDGWARWTNGPRATIRFRKPDGIERGGMLHLRLGAFVCRQHPRQRVTVSLNGRTLGVLELTEEQVGTGPVTVRIPVPAGIGFGSDELWLQFDLPDAQSPKSLGLSDDDRRLAIAMVEVALVPNSH